MADHTPEYDLVIIGSGLGGLLCGYLLAGRGYKVCVLEKNVQFGGCLQMFSRDKTAFDTGVHYIGELGEGEPLNQIFSYFGLMEKLTVERLDRSCFDLISFGEDTRMYPWAQGPEHFVKTLSGFFPDEREAISTYVNTLMEISDSFYSDNLKDLSYSSLNTKAMNTDAEAFIASITENTVLRNVLAGNIPLYGGKGGKTPLHQHALIISTYLKSAWRLVGGGAQIAKHLVAGIRSMGGDLFRRQNVTRLDAHGGEIRAAVTSDGKSYFGKQFIADFAPAHALSLVNGIPLRKSYLKRIVEVKPTTSFFALYVVFKPGQFPYLKHNVYHYDIANVWDATDYEEEKWPQSWLMYPEANENESPVGRATTILAYMRFDEVEKWALSNNTTAAPESRGEDYEDFKRLKAEKLIDAVEKKFSGFRSAIRSYHTATPLTFRDYLNVPQGAAYGNLKDYKLPQQAFISPGSKIPNLFFTGQYLHLHGIKGVSTSALVTCGAILGEPVFEQVMKGIKKP